MVVLFGLCLFFLDTGQDHDSASFWQCLVQSYTQQDPDLASWYIHLSGDIYIMSVLWGRLFLEDCLERPLDSTTQ